ncbi:MAG: alpha/beta hydrolase [Dehalococcoidia bacterium]|nr:alpha/beta hydrolase [Dehalococcoidia bacterium]
MPWIEVGETDIYYQEEGAGQPLVFLHGNTSCGEAWWQQFAHFRDRFRCIAYDSVNHGHSSNSPRDADEPDRADELERFLAALGISRPILAGNSMGGTRSRAGLPGTRAMRSPSSSGAGVARAGQPGATPPLQQPLSPDVLFLPIGDSSPMASNRSQPRMFERYLRIRSTATRLEAMRYPRRPPEDPRRTRRNGRTRHCDHVADVHHRRGPRSGRSPLRDVA